MVFCVKRAVNMGKSVTTNKEFVLVVGCPRSGTYLFSTMLQAHFRIGIPVETHFIPLFFRIRRLFGDLTKSRNRKRLLKCIFDFLAIWTPRAARDLDFAVIKKYSLFSTINCSSEILQNTNSYGEMVLSLFKTYSSRHSAAIVGDKSAFFVHTPLEIFEQIIPEMKVIHVIRDGRDASLSWTKIWTGPSTLAVAAKQWRNHVNGNRAWGRKNPDRYLEARYEDLLDDPEAVMRKVGNFLDLPFDLNAVPGSSELSSALAVGKTHPLLSQPIIQTNKGKWRKILSSTEQQLFEYIAGDALSNFGYETLSSKLSIYARSVFFWKILVAHIRDGMSLRNFQLQLKTLLPWTLWFCAILRIPIVKLLNSRRYCDYLLPNLHDGHDLNK